MTREQFEHAIRAAGAVLGVTELLVIGSQAVHGSMSGPLPIEAARSVEVDVAVRGDAEGRLADLMLTGSAASPAAPPRALSSPRARRVLGLVTLLVAAAGGAWWRTRAPSVVTDAPGIAARDASRDASLAVIPFVSVGGDTANVYLAGRHR